MKAWGLTERGKTKDGYDVVWILKAYRPEVAARCFREVGILELETEFGAWAIANLSECFQTHEHTSPVGWVIESN